MDQETSASYAVAGYGRSTEFGMRPCVLVVDMCAAYFTNGSPLDLGQPSVVESSKQIVAAARAAGVPVVWTRVEFEPGGANGGVWYEKVSALESFDRGNPLAAWLPGLEPDDGDLVITKQHASGFFGTQLANDLRSLDVDSMVVCGVSTSGCVRATVTDASASGFVPFVVRQGVGDRTANVHESNLFDIHAKYGDVVDEDVVIAYLGAL